MEMLQHAVYWAEIPVTDFERARKFYSTIYDYQMPEMQMGPNRMGFLLFQQQGGIGAAIVKGEGYEPSKSGIKLYLNGGSDLNLVLERVKEAGGKVLLNKISIGEGLGYVGLLEDTEGNHIYLHSAG